MIYIMRDKNFGGDNMIKVVGMSTWLSDYNGRRLFSIDFGSGSKALFYGDDMSVKHQPPRLTLTPEHIAAASSAIKNAIKKQYRTDTFFVRYGDIPDSGVSTNHATKKIERGVSCIEARQSLLTGEIELVPYGSPSWMACVDRPLYIVDGTLLDDRGSDGEPLLKNCKIIKRLH